MTKPNVIVCSACIEEGNVLHPVIIVGVRHWDALMRAQVEAAWDRSVRQNAPNYEQGFLDRFGTFHSRTEAWKIAEAAGQIKYRCGGDTKDGGTLYSENLY